MGDAEFQKAMIVILFTIATMITRFLPFLIFPAGKKVPDFVEYLGKTLPYATMGLLVVYCGGADRGASLVEGKFPVKHWCRNGILYVPGSGGFLIRDFGKKWIKFLVGL